MTIKMIRASWANGMPLAKDKSFLLDDEDAKMLIALGHAEETTDKSASNQSQKQRTMPQAVAA